MPMRILLPARPSRVRWFLAMLLLVVAVGSLLLEVGALESSEISSMSPLVCRNPLRLLSPTAVTMVVVKSTGTGMKTVLATGSRANHRWCLSFGAPGGQPACSAAAPPNPLAEGQPNLFLLALKLLPPFGITSNSERREYMGGSATLDRCSWLAAVKNSSDQVVMSPEPASLESIGSGLDLIAFLFRSLGSFLHISGTAL